MRKLDQVIADKINALYFGTRILLPFSADILKVVIDTDIIMDFSPQTKGAVYTKNDDFTELYLHDHSDILSEVTKFEIIKILIVENGKDIFDTNNHRKISLKVLDSHRFEVEELGEDVIFIV